MTPERLEQLADTWGADLQRWPEAERVAAQALLARDASSRSLLARAAELDALLDAHAIAPPDASLLRAVLAGAPGHAPDGAPRGAAGQRKRRQWLRNWWWSGAGVAGVGLVGTAVGAMAVAMALSAVTPASRLGTAAGGWATSAFESGSAGDWSEE
jgi:hypothetical protein